ncbi:MAG: formyltransferase family protein, partial [Nanoarchaeota archaeon]
MGINNLRVGAFVYNFEHKKTQEGLFNLYLDDTPVVCALAADPVPLTFYQSKIRIAPKGLSYAHPRTIAQKLGIPYHVVSHNSQECEDLVRSYNLDVGVILGARILKEPIINAFNVGVLNLHPGLLPE